MRYRWKDTSEIERATKRRKKAFSRKNPVAKELKDHRPKVIPDKRSHVKGNKGNLKHSLTFDKDA